MRTAEELTQKARDLTEALEATPRKVALWVRLAGVLVDLGELEQAKFALHNALQLAPRHKGARRELKKVTAAIRVQLQQPATAVEPWNAVQHHGPGSGSGRPWFTTHLGWAVPSVEAIGAIASIAEGGVLEIGAGLGLWSRLLRDADVDVVATDDFSTHQSDLARSTWTPVEPLGARQAVERYRLDVLLVCWPPRKGTMASDALDAFQGSHVVYVGEVGKDRVTGEDAFFGRIERDWRLRQQVQIPCWPGFSDALYVYERTRA